MIQDQAIIRLLNQFNPSGSALLDWLKPHIDDALLVEIASCDYGYKAQETYQALLPIRDAQELPAPLPWQPLEVLNLTRWNEPDDVAWWRVRARARGHLGRAFACAALLKAADSPGTMDRIHAENNTLIQLIASVLYLGHDATESALRFLCWRVLRLSDKNEEVPFFALGVLLLRAALFEPGDDGTQLSVMADWVVAEERDERVSEWASPRSDDWLLGLTFFDQQHPIWKKLAQQVLLNQKKSFPDPAATAMRDIVRHLVPEIGL